MVTFYTANGLVQEQEVIDDVRILLSDLGIGTVIHQGLDGALDGGAQLFVIGAEGDAVLARRPAPRRGW